jgi:hypothetical protein
MVNEIRFGDFLRQVSLEQHQLSYNEMTPDIKKMRQEQIFLM